MVSVPSSDLAAQYLGIRSDLDAAIHQVLAGGEFERDQQLWDFEDEFANACGVEYGVGVGSGLAAVLVALKAIGIGPGDEVITVPNTDISTCSAITHVGARIVWADVEESTHNIDPRRVEQLITPRSKAILAVSLYGLPADLPRLREIARRHHLWLVGDAALAFGATINSVPVGALADASCFSFAPTKVLGAFGDGGMVVTRDRALADRARQFAGYGERNRESMSGKDGKIRLLVEGYHLHLDVLQAAILRVKLPHVGAWISRRQEIAAQYGELLEGADVCLPSVPAGFTHVYRSFVVRVPHRDRVYRFLRDQGIGVSLLYVPPLHQQPAYGYMGQKRGDFPVVETLASTLLCLPLYPEMSDAAVRLVASELRTAIASFK
ncbi:MAG: DegT/DnrJ/EryC1/StrS family aminotransferase [Candidatus Dormiibacterota bacterium]